MKASIITLAYMFMLYSTSFAQDKCLDKYFLAQIQDIETDNQSLQDYEVSLKWQNLDALNGTTFNCNVVLANLAVDPENNITRWQDARLASIGDFREEPENTVSLPALDGFEYESFTADFLQEDFFDDIAPELRDLAKWLVSDAMQMQGLAVYVMDSLRFGQEFMPVLLEDYEIEFQNWVSFSSRYQELTWSAITKHNDEVCAVIKFESEYNPVSADTPAMSFKGRSLYYGEMWVSLQDKQLEYAIMFEDVIMKLESDAFPGGQLIDLQREIVFDKSR
ncbi:MAG: hypothetical protein RQ743_02665 [Bacteroidales bacterium]|nr:hypothetical protein [Bacteroidales bacterium]